MNFLVFFGILFVSTSLLAREKLDEMRLKGGSQFAKCYFCHSLKPDVHMTGPSLANMWNAKAGHHKDFKLYSDELKKSGLVWDEATLKNWLMNPKKLIPETTMTYHYDGDEVGLKNLIEFLKVAMADRGYETVLDKKWIAKEYADGQTPKSWKTAEKDNIIERIEYCKSIYTITKKNKLISRHWEENINLKVAEGAQGPSVKEIRILPTGSMGDRFSVIFPSFAKLQNEIKPCPK